MGASRFGGDAMLRGVRTGSRGNMAPKTKSSELVVQDTFFESQDFRRQIEKIITGSAQPNFGPSHLKQVRLPLPPLPLQKEFAQQVTEIRELEDGQAASRRGLDSLFQSMLHRAFNGEL
jgi:type I restriction enzyme, S subunit